MAALRLQGITKRFGATETVRGIDLDIASGEFVVLVGPSGCGKSTLLRMIAGLEAVSAGSIALDGKDITRAPPAARRVAMVFQSYALYPHMTVAQNLTFGMRMRGVAKSIIADKLAMAVEILRLQPYLERKPGELSGGQCQRVAIGRALVQEPAIFLFDEPLSNLDAELRLSMRAELRELHAKLGRTMIYVTHDQAEAMTLADRIVVLRDGRIEQVGAPLEIYSRPANKFVAGFIGSPAMNFLPVRFELDAGQGFAVLPDGTRLACEGIEAAGAGHIGIRPEHLSIAVDGPLQGRVRAVEHLGAASFVYVDAYALTPCLEVREGPLPRIGDSLRFAPRAGALIAFDGEGRALMSR